MSDPALFKPITERAKENLRRQSFVYHTVNATDVRFSSSGAPTDVIVGRPETLVYTYDHVDGEIIEAEFFVHPSPEPEDGTTVPALGPGDPLSEGGAGD